MIEEGLRGGVLAWCCTVGTLDLTRWVTDISTMTRRVSLAPQTTFKERSTITIQISLLPDTLLSRLGEKQQVTITLNAIEVWGGTVAAINVDYEAQIVNLEVEDSGLGINEDTWKCGSTYYADSPRSMLHFMLGSVPDHPIDLVVPSYTVTGKKGAFREAVRLAFPASTLADLHDATVRSTVLQGWDSHGEVGTSVGQAKRYVNLNLTLPEPLIKLWHYDFCQVAGTDEQDEVYYGVRPLWLHYKDHPFWHMRLIYSNHVLEKAQALPSDANFYDQTDYTVWGVSSGIRLEVTPRLSNYSLSGDSINSIGRYNNHTRLGDFDQVFFDNETISNEGTWHLTSTWRLPPSATFFGRRVRHYTGYRVRQTVGGGYKIEYNPGYGYWTGSAGETTGYYTAARGTTDCSSRMLNNPHAFKDWDDSLLKRTYDQGPYTDTVTVKDRHWVLLNRDLANLTKPDDPRAAPEHQGLPFDREHPEKGFYPEVINSYCDNIDFTITNPDISAQVAEHVTEETSSIIHRWTFDQIVEPQTIATYEVGAPDIGATAWLGGVAFASGYRTPTVVDVTPEAGVIYTLPLTPHTVRTCRFQQYNPLPLEVLCNTTTHYGIDHTYTVPFDRENGSGSITTNMVQGTYDYNTRWEKVSGSIEGAQLLTLDEFSNIGALCNRYTGTGYNPVTGELTFTDYNDAWRDNGLALINADGALYPLLAASEISTSTFVRVYDGDSHYNLFGMHKVTIGGLPQWPKNWPLLDVSPITSLKKTYERIFVDTRLPSYQIQTCWAYADCAPGSVVAVSLPNFFQNMPYLALVVSNAFSVADQGCSLEVIPMRPLSTIDRELWTNADAIAAMIAATNAPATAIAQQPQWSLNSYRGEFGGQWKAITSEGLLQSTASADNAALLWRICNSSPANLRLVITSWESEEIWKVGGHLEGGKFIFNCEEFPELSGLQLRFSLERSKCHLALLVAADYQLAFPHFAPRFIYANFAFEVIGDERFPADEIIEPQNILPALPDVEPNYCYYDAAKWTHTSGTHKTVYDYDYYSMFGEALPSIDTIALVCTDENGHTEIFPATDNSFINSIVGTYYFDCDGDCYSKFTFVINKQYGDVYFNAGINNEYRSNYPATAPNFAAKYFDSTYQVKPGCKVQVRFAYYGAEKSWHITGGDPVSCSFANGRRMAGCLYGRHTSDNYYVLSLANCPGFDVNKPIGVLLDDANGHSKAEAFVRPTALNPGAYLTPANGFTQSTWPTYSGLNASMNWPNACGLSLMHYSNTSEWWILIDETLADAVFAMNEQTKRYLTLLVNATAEWR